MCNVELDPYFLNMFVFSSVHPGVVIFLNSHLYLAPGPKRRHKELPMRLGAFHSDSQLSVRCRHVDLGPSRKSAYFSGQIRHCAGKPGDWSRKRHMPYAQYGTDLIYGRSYLFLQPKSLGTGVDE